MAELKICDKCGAELSIHSFEFRIQATKYDLCDECKKKLKKFLITKETSKSGQ